MRYWFIPLLAAIANTLLCVLVYRHDRRNPLNRAFCLATATIISWNLNIFSLYYFDDPESAFYWSKVFRTGTLMMPPAVLHAFLIFSGRWTRTTRAFLLAAYALVSCLILANAFDWLVAGIRKYEWGYYPVPHRLYALHALSVATNFLVAAGLLIICVRTAASAQKRLQAKFWLMAAGVGILAGVTNLLPVYQISVFPVGNVGNVAYTAIVAYAIVRHRLMDIDVVVTKGVAYAAVSVLLIAPAWAATLWLQRLSFGRIHPDFSAAILLMFVGISVLFPRLRMRAEARIEQSLFRAKHEYRSALTTFTGSIIRILDRERLIRELATTLSETLGLDRIAIAMMDEGKQIFTIRYVIGAAPATDEFPQENAFIRSLSRRPEVILRDELQTHKDARDGEGAMEVCQRNGWEACMPLTAGARLIGFIALGRKRNLDAFFAEDLDLLGTLAAEASIALENARLYEELKKSQDIIRRADRLSALGTLAAGIAHEVRNPLVSIQTFFQLAPERLHDEEFFTSFLGMTANEVKRISDLITELLSFARSPTRSLGPVNLNEVVERVATLLEPEAKKHKLTLTRTLLPMLPPVQADADQIKQVMINLVLNAIQATPADGEITISSGIVQHRDVLFGRVEVHDTGVGIPAEQLDHVFNPFFTTKDKGTGLGLAIAHQIITEHGGIISVQSTEGHGTTFFIDLPACRQDVAAVHFAEELVDDEPLALPFRQRRKVAS
jgi:two-component system NtrC family sensor kinase